MRSSNINWGTATPEAYDDLNKEALHILNVHFIGDANRKRVIEFICARMLHFNRHLPKGSSQRVRLDLRGQFISNKNLDFARHAIAREAEKHGIQIAVEFLTN